MDFSTTLAFIHEHFIYHFFLFYVAAYPIVGAILWTSTAYFFWHDFENKNPDPVMATAPFISVVIPAFNEAKILPATLRKVLDLNYPNFEVIVVSDGSTDETLDLIEPLMVDERLRIFEKSTNEGKARSINDVIPFMRGEFILFLDADAEPDAHILWKMLPHFAEERVGAVTGNPRIKNTDNFLCRIQLMEYTTIISLIRRAQQVWGSLMTVSGAVFAVRKTALLSVHGFSPNMLTEDIDLTWKLQRAFWNVVYEPAALAWIHSPSTWSMLWRQRRRWAKGLMQVLRKNVGVLFRKKYRHLWPVYIEASLSTLWQASFLVTLILSILFKSIGLEVIGVALFPYVWGVTIAAFSIMMYAVGTWFDKKYDKEVIHFYPYSIYYPIAYWLMMAVIATLSIPTLFRRISHRSVKWKTQRD